MCISFKCLNLEFLDLTSVFESPNVTELVMGHISRQALPRLLFQYPTMWSSLKTHLKIGHPWMQSTSFQSSKDLEWLDLKGGHHDDSIIINGRQGDLSYPCLTANNSPPMISPRWTSTDAYQNAVAKPIVSNGGSIAWSIAVNNPFFKEHLYTVFNSAEYLENEGAVC